MRIVFSIVLALALSGLLVAQETAAPQTTDQYARPAVATPSPDQPQTQAASEPAKPANTVVPPPPTPQAIVEAKKQFKAGLKLKSSGQTEAAFGKFEQASQLDPRSVEYVTAREFARQQLVMEALERGNKAMQAKNEVAANAEFRHALEYDPTNEFAHQRLKDSVWESSASPSRTFQVVQKSVEVSLSPSAELKDFQFRGDARTLITQVAKAYGITATIDDSVQARRVHFDIENVDFATAMESATRVTKTFWIPLSGSQMYVVADTAENRRNFERLAIRTFYLTDVDVAAGTGRHGERVARHPRHYGLFCRTAAESTITIRAPLPIVEAASKLIESLAGGRPEVMLDVRVYQISSSLVRQLGTQWPTQFTMFNISPALIASLGAGAQDLINQLIASGGINQANSQAIQALLAQLQQSTQNPLLSTPFATFGGGLTLNGCFGHAADHRELKRQRV